MKCANCNLCWVDPGEEYPTCHADPNWPAPCEEDDYEPDDIDDDCGFDPYEGCYTYDC